MVDDRTQRPFHSNEQIARGQPVQAPGRAPGAASGGDPLARLARLIGQNDPFSEFGRDGARRIPAPVPHQPAPAWDDRPAEAPAAHSPMPEPQGYGTQGYGTQNFGRQNFGGPPLAAGDDHYQAEHPVPGYSAARPGRDDDPYRPTNAQLSAEQADFYEDELPPRRRMGVLVIAGVFALAVIGTAGAFGYRALFGSSGSGSPPPVIKADSSPSKIVPASSKDPQSSKQITDRVNDRGLGEKLVSREEQPVDLNNKPAGVVYPQNRNSAPAPALGSGIVGSEPKRVRTIAIHPDQGTIAETTPPAPSRVTATAPARPAAPPPRVISSPPPAADPEPAPRPAVARVAPPVQQAAAPAPSSNAPLSLNPDAPARVGVAPPARAAVPVARAAAVAPTQIAPAAPIGGAGGVGYAVQVSSQRSEAEAQAAFRSLQGKFPGQLGGKQPLIHRVDLGAKGIYFRAMVGPFASGGEAGELCGSLKAAGGECIVQRN